ncbi:MAG: hypothetical protein HOH48_08785, partial [Candidatus Puniceispirillum sp.]|nr:hypothetical protein [Candidatus Puniceispirillum sp.]
MPAKPIITSGNHIWKSHLEITSDDMRGFGPDSRFAKDCFGMMASCGCIKQGKTAGTAS